MRWIRATRSEERWVCWPRFRRVLRKTVKAYYLEPHDTGPISDEESGQHIFCKLKSRNCGGRPRLSSDTIQLIQQMARDDSLWGAERNRGELVKLDIKIATATIHKYMRLAHPHRTPTASWSVFLKNHGEDVWACDFLPVIDLCFRQMYLFFIVEL